MAKREKTKRWFSIRVFLFQNYSGMSNSVTSVFLSPPIIDCLLALLPKIKGENGNERNGVWESNSRGLTRHIKGCCLVKPRGKRTLVFFERKEFLTRCFFLFLCITSVNASWSEKFFISFSVSPSVSRDRFYTIRYIVLFSLDLLPASFNEIT